jgi:hypothetical protein
VPSLESILGKILKDIKDCKDCKDHKDKKMPVPALFLRPCCPCYPYVFVSGLWGGDEPRPCESVSSEIYTIRSIRWGSAISTGRAS